MTTSQLRASRSLADRSVVTARPRVASRFVVLGAAVSLVLTACTGTPTLGTTANASAPASASALSSGSVTLSAPSPTPQAPTSFSAALAPWHLKMPLSRAVALADGAHVLLLGGLTPAGTSSADATTLDPATGGTLSTGVLAQAAHDAGGAVLGGRFVLFGGGSDSVLGGVQAYDPKQQKSTMLGYLPKIRADLSVAGGAGHAYVVGGFDGNQLDPSVLGTTDGKTFSTVATLAQPVRYAAVASLGKYVWVLGGAVGTTPTADIQRVDPATGAVTVTGHLPVALDHAVALVLNGTVLILGGISNGQPSAAMWRLDPATGTVVPAGTLPVAVSMPAAVAVGGVGYLFGGEGQSMLNTVMEIKPAP